MQTEQVKNKYNKDIKGKYNNKYEQERWFKNDIQKAGYDMTLNAIKKHAFASAYVSCFELGPGHGTWTKELLEYSDKANYDLLDISSEMLRLVKERFKDRENINYIESDFLEFKPEKQYDFFFSSRVIEYIPKKEEVIKKISDLIKPRGRGFIITKTPKYLRDKMLGRKIDDFHSGQIAPEKLMELFKKNNCKNIKIYPVTMSWPFWRSAKMNMLLHKTFGNHRLNLISQFFSESYCVVFDKK
ncbi:class I SAM-dependent methyltransferase [Candidatus Parcubacteria bacterium]|nr:class I SAM-dependent methyltransferase [Candidatus Parcubacteria bacterium]